MSKGKFLVEAYKSYDTSKVYNFNDAVDILLKNKRTKDVRETAKELNLSFSEVFEMLGFKDELDFGSDDDE